MFIFHSSHEDIVSIERRDRICSLILVVDEFSGLSLHPSGFSIMHLRFALIINGTLSSF